MNVFITGGTSGIGLALVKFYQGQGHTVATCSFEEQNQVSNILPQKTIFYQADVTNSQIMKKCINDFKIKYNMIDLVICNAGINHIKQKIPDFERARKVFDVNIIGVLNTLDPAIEIMKTQRSGHIVGIGSMSGMYGLPGMAMYGASKAAILNMFESFSLDLSEFGIDVTCVVPGFIDTPLTKMNKHKMPFMMSIETASKEIIWAISHKKNIHRFPKLLSYVSIVLKIMPRFLFRFIMNTDLLNLRKG